MKLIKFLSNFSQILAIFTTFFEMFFQCLIDLLKKVNLSLKLLQIMSQVIFIFYGNCAGAGAGAVLPRTLKMGARAGAVRAPKWGARLGATVK